MVVGELLGFDELVGFDDEEGRSVGNEEEVGYDDVDGELVGFDDDVGRGDTVGYRVGDAAAKQWQQLRYLLQVPYLYHYYQTWGIQVRHNFHK